MVNAKLCVPQYKGLVTPRQVMSNSGCATLGQIICRILRYPEVARYRIENRRQGAFPRTAILYDVDEHGNDKLEWVEGGGGFEIIDRFNFKGETKRGKLELPPTGYVVAYKDGRRWMIWSTDPRSKEYNGGFARFTGTREEAEESFLKAWGECGLFKGLTEQEVREMASKQYRKQVGKHGLRPVYCYSVRDYGPVLVWAEWFPGYFDCHIDDIGCLSASGYEQKAELFAMPQTKSYKDGLIEGADERTQEILRDISTMPTQEVLEKYQR